jgi:hypothetical protein
LIDAYFIGMAFVKLNCDNGTQGQRKEAEATSKEGCCCPTSQQAGY